jgi:hypothetical protein
VADATPYDQISLEFDLITGQVTVLGDPPKLTTWSAELITMLQIGQERHSWASLEDTPDGTMIVLDVEGGPLRYRLTGERITPHDLVAELVEPNDLGATLVRADR